MKVRALVNFEYPASFNIRNRIVRGETIPIDQRGRLVQVKAGQIVSAPEDLEKKWLRHHLVEEVEDDAEKQ